MTLPLWIVFIGWAVTTIAFQIIIGRQHREMVRLTKRMHLLEKRLLSVFEIAAAKEEHDDGSS